MNVIIGIDPHKATHTAVALDGNELELGEIQVRSNVTQLKRLLAWAAPAVGFRPDRFDVIGAVIMYAPRSSHSRA